MARSCSRPSQQKVGVIFHSLFSMIMEFKECKIISWNVRGAMNRRGQRHVIELFHKYNPKAFIVLEAHT